MPSPFPGMDPYLESRYWGDFHATFIPCWRRAINDVLPRGYRAHIDTTTNLIEFNPSEIKKVFPDVAVVYKETPEERGHQPGTVATVSPVTCTLPMFEEIKERWIEIVHEPDKKLVAVLELLSPWNKAPGEGRGDYLAKRTKIIRQAVHLIELDLLLNGLRLPMADPLPPGDYFALVSRSERRPKCDVYGWGLRDKLPPIPIPLLTGDPDSWVDLSVVFAAAYELGGYAESEDYTQPPDAPIPEKHRSWVAELANSAKPR